MSLYDDTNSQHLEYLHRWQSNPNRHRIFSQIETIGKLPDGRFVVRTISYPHGADYAEYLRLDDAMCTAFGSVNCRTIGTPWKGKPTW